MVTLDYSREVTRRWGRSRGQVVQKLRFICKGKDKCRAGLEMGRVLFCFKASGETYGSARVLMRIP